MAEHRNNKVLRGELENNGIFLLLSCLSKGSQLLCFFSVYVLFLSFIYLVSSIGLLWCSNLLVLLFGHINKVVGFNRQWCAEPSYLHFFVVVLCSCLFQLGIRAIPGSPSNQTMANLTPSPSVTTADPTPLNLNTDQQSIIADNSSLFGNMMIFNSPVKLDQNNFLLWKSVM